MIRVYLFDFDGHTHYSMSRRQKAKMRKRFSFMIATLLFFTLCENFRNFLPLSKLAKLRRPPAAFLLNRAITRGANGTKTFSRTYPSYMQSFIKIGVLVLEKSAVKKMTLRNFNKDEITLKENLSIYNNFFIGNLNIGKYSVKPFEEHFTSNRKVSQTCLSIGKSSNPSNFELCGLF